ncbi:hypothetical protein M0805_002845 [Coniferiporia weirii]|nr:hypothetical protein M0805_002845 [Coniferiporia weirii]
MRRPTCALAFAALLHLRSALAGSDSDCRNVPGDAGYPTQTLWNQLNTQLNGRLVPVIPSAEFCHTLPSGNCTADQWVSSNFRGAIPGAMEVVNWEQDYASRPPSTCFLDINATCGQGEVPLRAINVSSVADIQTGLKFAVEHNLKVAMKSSGHDLLGRSTGKGVLLFWVHYMRNVSFTESFFVGEKNEGSAVTVESGVPLSLFYSEARARGKVVVGGTAANVAPAGGYVQGAGHSAFSPLFGLAADNALEFKIVLANGDYITANEIEHPDLFWALRGGGAGSWGIVVSATFRTYPAFDATFHSVMITSPTTEGAGQLAEIHARHIFDWDNVHAGQYFYFYNDAPLGGQSVHFWIRTYFANYSADDAVAAMKPLLDEVKANNNFTILFETTNTSTAIDLIYLPDEPMGYNVLLGSRLISADAYRTNVSGVGAAYKALLDEPLAQIGGHLVAGGKVSENVDLNSVNPKWRTAKAHVFLAAAWPDSMPAAEIIQIQNNITKQYVPTLASIMDDDDSGAYSNEADPWEPDFQKTFFGPYYGRLLSIKKRYDPEDTFIVRRGVGSENWDDAGVCRITQESGYEHVLDPYWSFVTAGYEVLFKS